MGDVIEKMLYQVPHRLLGFQVFLTALMTIPAYYGRLTIQTVFFLSFFKVRHRGKIWLKIRNLACYYVLKRCFFRLLISRRLTIKHESIRWIFIADHPYF